MHYKVAVYFVSWILKAIGHILMRQITKTGQMGCLAAWYIVY